MATWNWYSDWWTEGEALRLRNQINDTKRRVLASGVPEKFSWNPAEPGGGTEFQQGLGRVLEAAWRHLVAIGATKLDRWATFREVAAK